MGLRAARGRRSMADSSHGAPLSDVILIARRLVYSDRQFVDADVPGFAPGGLWATTDADNLKSAAVCGQPWGLTETPGCTASKDSKRKFILFPCVLHAGRRISWPEGGAKQSREPDASLWTFFVGYAGRGNPDLLLCV